MPDSDLKPGASDTATHYWDSVSNTAAKGPTNGVWRRHSDTVNERLLSQWLHTKKYPCLLKTDLFDESIGVGLCSFLSSYSDEIHGVDISEVCARAASERYPGMRPSVADILKLPYASGYFDCIVSNSTLDHFPALEDIETSLGELNRVLRPGGEVIVTLDNLQNPVIWLRSILPYQWLHRIGVLPYYVGATTTKTGLKKMLDEAGFQVTASAAILHCPRVAAVPLSNWAQRHCTEQARRRWLGILMAFEWLGRTPLRYLTGHVIAVRAIKPPGPGIVK
jgi:SAM-dependent methyltransferase